MCLKRSLPDFISKMKKLKKGSEVEVTCEKEMFKVSWNKAILQENPAKMKGKKLRVCFTTLVDKDSLSPYTETVEQCFIRPVQPQYLNKAFVFERGSVVDAYAHAGWWKSVIVKEVPKDRFLVYFDFIPDIAKFDKYQLRPNADWTGSKWQLSEDIYSPGKIVEMTRRIRKMENIWVPALLIKQIEVDGERKFIIKRLTQFLRLSDDDEEEAIFKTVDICKTRPCPPQYFFAKYILGDIVEVFVSCGWLKGEVREILCGNKYLVQFKAVKEEAVYKSSALRQSMDWQDGHWIHTREVTSKSKNDDATPLISPQESPSNTHVLDGAEDDLMNDAPTATHESSSSTLVLESNEDEILTPEESYSKTNVLEATENPISHESGDTMNDDATSPIINPQEIPIDGTEDDLINDAPTPTIATQERSSSTLVLESNEDDMMNGYATEIRTPEESYSNTPILEATDNETPINEAVVAFELPLPHESDDTMNDDACSPIIEAQEIPIDPEIHCDLVEDVDIQFGKVFDLVRRGYHLKRQDWLNGSVNIAVAEAEENEQNAERELGEEETFQSFIDSRKQEKTKVVGELNENASKESVLVKKKKRARENKLVVYDYDTHGERMSTSADKIVLPKRVFEPGSEKGVLDRVNKHCTLKYVAIVKEALGSDFKKIEDSFLGPIIQMGMRDKAMVFSRNLIHELLLRRIKVGKKNLWSALPCWRSRKRRRGFSNKKKKKDPWMMKNHIVKTLVELFVKNSEEFTANQKLRLGATILVELILIANNPVNKIPVERLLRARNFKEFCKYPWGNETYDALRAAVEKITTTDLVKEQYGISGFIYAIQLRALSSVDQLGSFFGDEDEETQFPLCLHWIRTKSPTMDEVVVKFILGDPELHSNLVEDVDTEFGKVVDLVKRGYRLKRQDWRSGSVNIAVAEAEIEENNYGPGTDATDKEKIEFLTKQLEIYKEGVEQLEDLLGIRRETEKETDEFHATPQGATKTKENYKNLERELEDDENLQFYIDSIRQQVSKVVFLTLYNALLNSKFLSYFKVITIYKIFFNEIEKTQDEEEQLVDNDAEDGEKERETSEDKEGQIEEAERNGEEVAISGEGSETSKDNEDEEVNEDASKESEQVADSGEESETSKDDEDEEENEDASKEPEQVIEKKQGKRKKDRMEKVEDVNEDTTNICKEVKKKKPRREKKRNTDEEPVNDDTVVDEDGKADEPNQGAGARTSKSKKQKIQPRDVSADDVIGGVLEDLNLKKQEEKEQVDDEAEKPVQVEQKKRGRPAGRKNKTHEGKEQQGEANDEAEKSEKGEKNKPGRKGKTNEEKKQQVEADDEAKKAEKGEKKKPGRPTRKKGKTNEEKKQQVEADDEAEKPEQVEKRKLGRPAGRKRAVAGTSISEKQKTQAGKDSTDDPE
ncbi:hypothetical protein Bca52824_000357 [Brassica carinata]|uniref:Agenet domain-containing protein n=1 Tax=Brassica carinata TaxID=52824 RepID=A0A8X7WH11_BRACI|nr:hypothetical protein Bca52824_000357 [Brassica carinata]